MILAASQTMQWLIWPVAMVVSAVLDGIFSGMEMGVYVLNKNRLDLHAEANKRQAVSLKRMLAKPNSLLAVLLIGTNLSRYVVTFAISTMLLLAGHSETSAEWYTLAIATSLMFVIGDAVPKIAFQRIGEAAVYRLVWFLTLFTILFKITGLHALVVGSSKLLMKLTGADSAHGTLGHAGAAALVAEGQASGVLTHFQTVMADRVMHIAKVTAHATMVPMKQTVSVGDSLTRDELMDIIRKHRFSRLPMVDTNGQVTGILNVYDAMLADDRYQGISAQFVSLPLVLDASTSVTEALYRMRQTREAMAVVQRNEKHVGIVTIKDLVEEIVGELHAW